MDNRLRMLASAALACFALLPLLAGAAAKLPWEEYDKLVKTRATVGALGPDLFGDEVNHYNSALSFSHTDISIPGNNKLPVALTRTYTVSSREPGYPYDFPFLDWDLDLPRLSGVFAPDWQDDRCSGHPMPPTVTVGSGSGNDGSFEGDGFAVSYAPQEYWHGNQAHMPAGGEMLLNDQGAPQPTSGGPYRWMTSGFTYFSCLPDIQNGSGEGFLAIGPDGTKYRFDWMAQYYEPPLQSAVSGPPWGAAQLNRKRNVLYATRVEDRFGNWVSYSYDNAPTAPVRLTGIQSSDLRQITLSYNAAGKIASASDGTRTWTYQYANGSLSAVVLPDSSRWTIDFAQLSNVAIEYDGDAIRNCDMTAPAIGLYGGSGAQPDRVAGRITHPSGAVGEFEVGIVYHGRSNVPKACINWETPDNNPQNDVATWPMRHDLVGLKRKRVTGPGLAAMEWTYEATASWSWAAGTGPTCDSLDCAAPKCLSDTCAGTAVTTVNGPNGEWVRYTHGNSYRYNEGKLLRVERGGGSTTLRTETTRYELAQSGQPFKTPIGTSPQPRGDGFTSEYLRPERSRTIEQDAVSFVRTVDAFDEFARPVNVTRSSILPPPPPVGTPTLTAPATSNTGSYTVSWTSVDTATSYQLQQRKDGGSWATIHDASGTSKAVSGLGNGSYDYQVRACNDGGCGPYSAIKTTVVTHPPGSAPTLTAPATSNTGSYTISWTSVDTATTYQLQQRKDAGAWSTIHNASGTSKSVSGLTSGSYDYQARACNTGGCGPYSAIKSTVVTLPPTGVPTLTAPATSNTGSYTVSWTSVAAATRYELQEQVNGGTWGTIQNTSAISRSITGKATGSYGYRVRACNDGGCASFSSTQTTQVTLPPTGVPTLTAPATNNTGSYSVSWTSVTAATRYELQEQVNGGTFGTIQNTSATSRSITGKGTASYGYRIRACNDGGCASFSSTQTTQVTLPPTGVPTLTAPATSNNGSYTLSWTSVSTATSYQLQQRKDGGSWSTIHSASGTSKAVSGLGNGTYDYQVRACNDGGCAAFSTIKTTVVTHPPGSAPTLTAPATSNNGSYTVSWTSVATATSYQLQQRKDGGAWSTIHNASGTSKAVSGLGNGTYDYQARACNVGGCSAFSAIKTTVVTHPPSSAPSLTAPSASNTGSYTVSWTSVATATRYELQEQVNGGTWGLIQNTSAISRSITGKGNGTYGYRVRACNVGGCSAFSAIASTVVTHPPGSAPTLSAPSASNTGSYTVSWTSVATATRYELQEQVNGGTWALIQNTSAISRSITGKGNGTYGYRVRACNVGGCSAFSAIKTTVVTHPPASAPTLSVPGGLNSTGSYTVSWTAVDTATRYELQEMAVTYGGSWTTIHDAAERSKYISGQFDGQYDYRVRACNVGGCGPYSATGSVYVARSSGDCDPNTGFCSGPMSINPLKEEL